eukprot:4230993-Pleurochrysis_carterae.AAC.4
MRTRLPSKLLIAAIQNWSKVQTSETIVASPGIVLVGIYLFAASPACSRTLDDDDDTNTIRGRLMMRGRHGKDDCGLAPSPAAASRAVSGTPESIQENVAGAIDDKTLWHTLPAAPSSEQSLVSVSRQLTRCHTLHATFDKLGLLGSTGPCDLHCHVLGADVREGSTPSEAAALFEPLRLLVSGTQCSRLHLLFCGPNCGTGSSRTAEISADKYVETRGSSMEADLLVRFEPSLYHDLLASDAVECPQLAVAFNAGIWGYDTWRSSVDAVLSLGAPMLVTAYNFFEAEADEDVFEAMGLEWLWRPTPNPWRSLQRENHKSTQYGHFENAATQCLVKKGPQSGYIQWHAYPENVSAAQRHRTHAHLARKVYIAALRERYLCVIASQHPLGCLVFLAATQAAAPPPSSCTSIPILFSRSLNIEGELQLPAKLSFHPDSRRICAPVALVTAARASEFLAILQPA